MGIGRNILTRRLTRLVGEGMLERRPYQDRPVRHEYVLTAKGRDFFPVIAAIMRWGARGWPARRGPPAVLHHRTCDHDTQAEVVCSHCREPLALRDVAPRA